jgi:serine/threonine protein kinase/Flp pilus assembly protein TadD
MNALLSSLNASRAMDARLEQIVEAAICRLQDGKRVDAEALAAAHPEYAGQLRELLPTVAMMVNLGAGVASDGDLPPSPSPSPPRGEEFGEQARQIGDFRIIRELGRGGMGMVYEAEQVSMGRRVALKVLPFAAIARGNALQRFRNEVRAAAALDHPHIVSIYSVGEERGVHYYAMQLVRGRTLADLIGELRRDRTPSPCPLPEGEGKNYESPTVESSHIALGSTIRDERALINTTWDSRRLAEYYRTAARLGIEAAEALQHAHDQGVLHRDIKPSNLLLDAEGKLYVTDFGLARIEADAGMTMTGDLVGTLRYMAPEQALAKRVVIDHRADMYSLGATLYELLTLQPAFGESDRSQLLKQIAFEEPRGLRKIDRHIPSELETIVLKAMAKNPEERYQTCQRLADDLRAFLDDKPIKAKPPTAWHRTLKWSRRHKPLVASAGISTAALVVLSFAMLIYSNVAITRERNAKTAALQERTAALARAESNFNMVLAVIDRSLESIGDRTLADVPQMEKLRKKLLDDSLEFYEKLLAQNPGDPAVRFAVARVYVRVAHISQAFANWNDAIRQNEAAIAILEDLLRLEPSNASFRAELGTAYKQRGWNAMATSFHANAQEGARWPRRAVELFQGLHDEFPNNTTYRAALLEALLSLNVWSNGTKEKETLLARMLPLADSPHMNLRLLGEVKYTIAAIHLEHGRLDEAEESYRESIQIHEAAVNENPTDLFHLGTANRALGDLLFRRGEFQEAIDYYRKSLDTAEAIRRDFPTAAFSSGHNLRALPQLVVCLHKLGRTDEATELLANWEILNAEGLNQRGTAYHSIGQFGKAVRDYEQVLKLTPNSWRAYNTLAWSLATVDNADIRDGKRAVELATKACEMTDFRDPVPLDTLAVAHAEVGDFSSAEAWQEKAIHLVNDKTLRQGFIERLKSYKAKQPWRE